MTSPRYSALLASDLDGTLVGDPVALATLNGELAALRGRVALAYVTGRSLPSTLALIATEGLLTPDFIVSDVGTHLYHGPHWTVDVGWHQRMSRGWHPSRVRGVARFFPALVRQPPDCQTAFKCSYYLDEAHAPATLAGLREAFSLYAVGAHIVYSGGRFLDLLPPGGGKGTAVRYLADQLGLPLDAVLTCGDSGNDREMLLLGCKSAIVSNHEPELDDLVGRLYRSNAPYAAGVHEALHHYGLML